MNNQKEPNPNSYYAISIKGIPLKDFVKVTSSNIQSVHYDEKTKRLKVLFKNERCYEYQKVEKEVYDNILFIEKVNGSIGKYLNEVLFRNPSVNCTKLNAKITKIVYEPKEEN